MAVALDIRTDLKQINKMLGSLEKSIGPRVIVRSINDTAKQARTRAMREAVRKLRLPRKLVVNRLTLLGSKKADRARLTKATRVIRTALLTVYQRGIPVFQVANKAPPVGKQRPGGVKAKGGRFYKGAFYAPKRGRMFVFKRMGARRYPVFVPRIGVAKLLDKLFKRYTIGRRGRVLFRKNYTRLIRFEIQKLNNSGRG